MLDCLYSHFFLLQNLSLFYRWENEGWDTYNYLCKITRKSLPVNLKISLKKWGWCLSLKKLIMTLVPVGGWMPLPLPVGKVLSASGGPTEVTPSSFWSQEDCVVSSRSLLKFCPISKELKYVFEKGCDWNIPFPILLLSICSVSLHRSLNKEFTTGFVYSHK